VHVSSECLGAALLVKWNVDYLARAVDTLASTASSAGVESETGRASGSGTLLGPEGSSASSAPSGSTPIERPVGVPYVDGYAMTRFDTARTLRTA
jgi:hypothetical protein